jgi:hypothetical protein
MHCGISRHLEDMTNVNMYHLEMNSSKLTSVLSQSSRVFVPIGDPALDFFREAAEVNVPLKNVTFSNLIFSDLDGVPWQRKQEKYCRSVFR